MFEKDVTFEGQDGERFTMARKTMQEIKNGKTALSKDNRLGVNENNHLTIEGWDTCSLAKEFGTPLWVVSENTLVDNFRTIRKNFEKYYDQISVAYASKANHAPAILSILQRTGALIDCASATQLQLATVAGVPGGKLIFNGNNKTRGELATALDLGVGLINVDNEVELDILNTIARDKGKVPEINLRVRGGYSSIAKKDREFVEAATKGDKFGIDIPSGQALAVCKKAFNMNSVRLRGISHHVGWSVYGIPYSKDLDLKRISAQAEEIISFSLRVQDELGFIPEIIDLGGGFRKIKQYGFGPSRIREIPSCQEYAKALLSPFVRKDVTRKFKKLPQLIVEPGGYIVSDAVTLLSSVGCIKSVNSGPGAGKWAALDSSAYFFVRKLIYNFYHHTVVANKMRNSLTDLVDLVGPTCAYDYVADKIRVPKLERGDLIAILDQGAYCEAISTQYCGIPRPAAILVNRSQKDLIRKRETPEDMISQYLLPNRLTKQEYGTARLD